MYSILIVDDEKIITEGLKLILERSKEDYYICGVAYNGLEGIDSALKEKPDIIITDVRMHQMDGLEMIRRLKEAGVEAKFIILSGYSDFNYAKKAIEMAVKFYITKPVEEEELYEALNKACIDIEAERTREFEVQELKKAMQSNINSLKEFVLRDILDSGVDNTTSVKYMLDLSGFPVSFNQYVCSILEFNCEPEDFSEFYSKHLLEKMENYLGIYSYHISLHYARSQIAIIIADQGLIDYSQLTCRLADIKNYIKQALDVPATMGIGLIYGELDGVSQSFEEARQALSYKVIKGAGSVITYSEIQKITGSRNAVSDEDISRLEACIDNLDIQESRNIIEDIFDKMSRDKNLRLADLQIQCINILLSGTRKMSVTQLQINEFVGKNILSLKSISRFKTLEQLKNWLINTIHSIIQLKLERKVPAKKDIIGEIKEYVADHFNTDISLAELSDKFFMNPYYLSQLFKEKTGETYLNYLTRVRINKAKELLESTDLKIYNICEMVGYSDTNYFSKLFEKTVGCRPSEYKKKQG